MALPLPRPDASSSLLTVCALGVGGLQFGRMGYQVVAHPVWRRLGKAQERVR